MTPETLAVLLTSNVGAELAEAVQDCSQLHVDEVDTSLTGPDRDDVLDAPHPAAAFTRHIRAHPSW